LGAYLTSTYISSSVQLGAGLAMVEDKNFSGNAVTFSGLTGNYIYVCYLAGSTAGAGDMTIKINNNVLATNYWRGEMLEDDIALSGERANDNSIGAIPVAGNHVWEVVIGGDVYANNVTYKVRQQGLGADTITRVLSGNFGAVAITSIGFVCSVGFAGRAILYRIGQR